MGNKPVLAISDPQLIKDILIKDFHKFVDRSDMKMTEELQQRSLFNMKGNEWKNMRSIVSQTINLSNYLNLYSNC